MLEQEQHAELPKTEPVPASPAPKKEEKSEVSPLQTYRGDVEHVVQEGKGVSVVSIAAAEAERRGKMPLINKTPEEIKASLKSWSMIAAGAVLLLAAAGALSVVFLRQTTTLLTTEKPRAPFIFVDEVAPVTIPIGQGEKGAIMSNLQTVRRSIKMPIGLIEWVYLTKQPQQEGATPAEVGVTEFLQTIAPQIPPELMRTIEPTYLVGIHSFEENQPFLLLQVDSYETAYAGMLAWERTLQKDLLPFFGRNPSPKMQGTAPPASTTPQFLQTAFVDKVVENRDTRAYLNDAGDVLLLWTVLGRNIILITTNEYTLREVISRLNTAPVVPIPGQ